MGIGNKFLDLENLQSLRKGQFRDGDPIDRMNHKYTPIILIIFAAASVFFLFEMFDEKPVLCWCPVHLTDAQIQYANDFCWVKNTYYIPWNDNLPKAKEGDTNKKYVTYYQWVPAIFFLQAILFKLPNVIWHQFNSRGGIDCDDILSSAAKVARNTGDTEERDKQVMLVTNQLHRFCKTRKNERRKCGLGRRSPYSLVSLYLLMKFLFLVNIIGQFLLLNAMLSSNYTIYGYEIVKFFMSNGNEDWTETPSVVFPRVTFCDMNIRRLGNVHRYTLQCVLPCNFYNEKMFGFMWFWMFILFFLNLYGLAAWFSKVCFCCKRGSESFFQRHLFIDKEHNQEDMREKMNDTLLSDFMNNFLKTDGVFILKLMSINIDPMTITDVMNSLYEKWFEDKHT